MLGRCSPRAATRPMHSSLLSPPLSSCSSCSSPPLSPLPRLSPLAPLLPLLFVSGATQRVLCPLAPVALALCPLPLLSPVLASLARLPCFPCALARCSRSLLLLDLPCSTSLARAPNGEERARCKVRAGRKGRGLARRCKESLLLFSSRRLFSFLFSCVLFSSGGLFFLVGGKGDRRRALPGARNNARLRGRRARVHGNVEPGTAPCASRVRRVREEISACMRALEEVSPRGRFQVLRARALSKRGCFRSEGAFEVLRARALWDRLS